MAPERFQGRCDARSDVYALGLTLYELLAFRPAFPASDRHDLIRQIAQEEPPRLRRLDPSIPRDLETIVHKALEKDPAHRYATAQQMADDLRRFLDDRPIRARRAAAHERLARWARRNPWLAGMTAAVLVLLVAIDIVAFVLTRQVQAAALEAEAAASRERAAAQQAEAAARRERDQRQVTEQQKQVAEQQNEDLRWKDYVYRLALADREIDASNLGAAQRLLEGCPEDFRDNFEYRYVYRRAHLDIPRFTDVKDDVVSLDYSPDGKWLFAAEGRMYYPDASHQAELVKRDAMTGEVVGRLSVAGSIRSIDVSPDGEWVAIGIGYRVFRTTLSSAGEVILADTRTLGIGWRRSAPGPWWANAVAFSPDSEQILVGYATSDSVSGTKSGSAELLAQPNGKVLRTFPGLGPEEVGFGDVAFHPQGRMVALGSDERIALYDLDTDEPIDVINTLQRNNIYALAFSPEGRYLASAGWGGTIHLWDTKTWTRAQRLDDHRGFVRDLAFSPDGRSLASASEDRSVRLWDVETGESVALFHGHAFHAVSVAWHPEGLLLASGGTDDAIKLWDMKASRPVVKWQLGWVWGLAFDPTSGHEVIATQGGGESSNDQFRIWNPTTGESIDEPGPWDPVSVTSFAEAIRARGLRRSGSFMFSAVALSADGCYIATADRGRNLKVREKTTGKLVHAFENPEGYLISLAFTPDGDHLISWGGFWDPKGLLMGTVVRWDLKTGREQWRKTLERGLINVALSPDGRRIAVGGGAGQLVLLDAVDGRVIATPVRDPEFHITSCAFDADGTRLAVGCSDPQMEFGVVKVFDVATWREISSLSRSKVCLRAEGMR